MPPTLQPATPPRSLPARRELPGRDALVVANWALCEWCVYRFARRLARSHFDEMHSEAAGALLHACDHYDESRGVHFSTYATECIRRRLWRAMARLRALAARAPASLDSKGPGGGLAVLLAAPPCEERRAGPERAQALRRALAVLGRRERRVIERRFLEGRTLGEVGRELGVSGERARQVQGRALGRLAELCPELEDHIN